MRERQRRTATMHWLILLAVVGVEAQKTINTRSIGNGKDGWFLAKEEQLAEATEERLRTELVQLDQRRLALQLDKALHSRDADTNRASRVAAEERTINEQFASLQDQMKKAAGRVHDLHAHRALLTQQQQNQHQLMQRDQEQQQQQWELLQRQQKQWQQQQQQMQQQQQIQQQQQQQHQDQQRVGSLAVISQASAADRTREEEARKSSAQQAMTAELVRGLQDLAQLVRRMSERQDRLEMELGQFRQAPS
jgi:DNA repair exonuclease SbcCD ATPase subunit